MSLRATTGIQVCQQLIPSDALPTPKARLDLFETARQLLLWDHYAEVGIDHFATKDDGLTIAQKTGRLRRNFQGYTDDTAEVLIGVGASSISRFPQGYAQNTPATGTHTAAIRDGRFSTARGHVFTSDDRMRSRMIEALMCDFRIDFAEVCNRFGIGRAELMAILRQTAGEFAGLVKLTDEALVIPPEVRPLTRLIARSLDAYALSKAGHSSAI